MPHLARQDHRWRPAVLALRHRDRRPRALAPPRPQQRRHGARPDQRLVAEEDHSGLDLRPHRLQPRLQRRGHARRRLRVVDQLGATVDRALHVVLGVDDNRLVTAALGGGFENVAHHRHAVDVEQQLLRTGHARALPRREHDAADGKERRREALERRTRRTDPLHLDAGADRRLREVAQAPAVAVDEQQPAPGQLRKVGHLLR